MWNRSVRESSERRGWRGKVYLLSRKNGIECVVHKSDTYVHVSQCVCAHVGARSCINCTCVDVHAYVYVYVRTHVDVLM